MVMSQQVLDNEIKELLSKVALVCLSEEFKQLRNELEEFYTKYNEEDAPLTAFKDALFTILAQEAASDKIHIRAN